MKKIIALLLSAAMCASIIAGCDTTKKPDDGTTTAPATSDDGTTTAATTPAATEPVKMADSITVATSMGGTDGNRSAYEAAFTKFQTDTGVKVNDQSATGDEAWKSKINADFTSGNEPDVLYYWNTSEAKTIIDAGKVVPIDEIRTVYPDYASNMKDSMMGAYPGDGKNYSVPLIGFWEALYANKAVLAECGVAVPDATTTWDQFKADCATIKAKGYTPIAVSLLSQPHYWFEFCAMNQGNYQNHLEQPAAAGDAVATKWGAAFNDLKEMYDLGMAPANTLTAIDEETFQLFYDGQAAFAIDGSWKLSAIIDNVGDRVGDYVVTYVPAKGIRKSSEIIGGLSMGFYITRKAWDDPAKREAAVAFVKAMTTDSVVLSYNPTAYTALANADTSTVDPKFQNSFVDSAFETIRNSTGLVGATQDVLIKEAREAMFALIPDFVTGKLTADELLIKAGVVPEA